MSSNIQNPEKISLLYIEDDAANRDLVRLIFSRRKDITLLEAEDGASGLHSATSNMPDIILLDLTLPDSTGYEILDKLRNTPEIASAPVIALTGNTSPTDKADGLKAGFFGYLTKPINIQELYEMTDSAVAAIRQRKMDT